MPPTNIASGEKRRRKTATIYLVRSNLEFANELQTIDHKLMKNLTCWYLETLSSRLRSNLVASRFKLSNWSIVPPFPSIKGEPNAPFVVPEDGAR
jgi:hypothetical protein